jgi:hypothetical protein
MLGYYLYFKQYKQYNVLIYTFFYMSVSMSKVKRTKIKKDLRVLKSRLIIS